MGLFRNLESRHIGRGEDRTTVAMEPEFWLAVDRHAAAAGVTCREWVQAQLKNRPVGQGRASWLRVTIINLPFSQSCDILLKEPNKT